MSRRRLVVHAGAGKTGSSAIQRFLTQNKTHLDEVNHANLGMFFEDILGWEGEHESPAQKFGNCVALGSEYARSEILKKFRKCAEILPSRVHTLVWSNEGIFEAWKQLGPLFNDLVDIFDCRFVVYLRRQDQWFISAYKQWGIRHKTYSGRIKSFEEWYSQNKARGDYSSILRKWEQNIPRNSMDIRVYNPKENSARDFCKVLRLEAESLQFSGLRNNQTPPNTILALFKLYNSQFQEPVFPDELLGFIRRTGILKKEFFPESLSIKLPGPDRRKEILEEYKQSNENLADYLAPHEAQFVGEEVEADDNPNSGEVDESQAFAALLHACVNLERRVHTLEAEIASLRETGSSR